MFGKVKILEIDKIFLEGKISGLVADADFINLSIRTVNINIRTRSERCS